MGVTDDGEITALQTSVIADTGGYPNGVGHIVLSNGRDRPLDMYRIPNYEYEGSQSSRTTCQRENIAESV